MTRKFTYSSALAVLLAVTLVFCVAAVPCIAADRTALPSGHVIYRQSFADTKGAVLTGIYFGTLSATGAHANNNGGSLLVNGCFDTKSYLLLPAETEGNTYTLTATLRLSDLSTSSGYCGILISGWGSEPRNRTEIKIRASGSIDDFSSPSDAMRRIISSGSRFTVTVPVRNGAINELVLSADGVSETIVRDQIKIVTGGTVGLSLRNMSIELSEILLINGTDFTELSGVFASNSYSTSQNADDGIFPKGTTVDPSSPPTADPILFISAIAIFAAGGVLALTRKTSKRSKL